ncbi:hypothetical protein A9261_21370 [Vibrio tasmaniensis]|nr:hypothetical protein A9261_21370 [Vibrio tasmaniensis]
MSDSYGLEFEIAYLIMNAHEDFVGLTADDEVEFTKLLAMKISKKQLKDSLLTEMDSVIQLYNDDGWDLIALNYSL